MITYFDVQIFLYFKTMDFNNTSEFKKLCEVGQDTLLFEFQFFILHNKGVTLENILFLFLCVVLKNQNT